MTIQEIVEGTERQMSVTVEAPRSYKEFESNQRGRWKLLSRKTDKTMAKIMITNDKHRNHNTAMKTGVIRTLQKPGFLSVC